MKVHFIDNFKIGILFDIDIFIFYKFVLNCAFQFVIINNCQSIKISIRFIVKSHSQIKRVVKIKITFTLLSNIIINISINYYDTLSNDRDYLFEFELTTYFDNIDEMFVYVIDCSMIFV